MTDLPRDLRSSLSADFIDRNPGDRVARTIVRRHREVPAAARPMDGRSKSVFIPDTPAMTFCISTQVGCAMACAFCLTGKMGLVRNLTAGEIAGQVRVLADAVGLRDKAFNIVLMGMGEPLHNYDAVMKAMRILCDEHGFALPPRRVTLSTVGLLPALERLAREPSDAEPRDLAARAHRSAARRAGADQPEVRRRRHHRGLQALPSAEARAGSRSNT